MAVYNGERYLREAVDSILSQTFRDFEFLIINDASTDSSQKIIKSYRDKRIRLVINEKNIGLTKSLNNGIELAQGKYLARMDADDVALPGRLKVQLEFMETHPKVVASGCSVESFTEDEVLVLRLPTEPEAIKAHLLFYNVLNHSTAIIRTNVVKKKHNRYDESFRLTQDYDLWVRLAGRSKLKNLHAVLLRRRVHNESAGMRRLKNQINSANRVRERQLEALGLKPTPKEIRLHNSLGNHQFEATVDYWQRTDIWFREIKKANSRQKIYTPAALNEIFLELATKVLNQIDISSREKVELIRSSSAFSKRGMQAELTEMIKSYTTSI